MKFVDKRSNEIKTAYSIEKSGDRIKIKFTEHGKEYFYNPENIRIIEEVCTSQIDDAHSIYRFSMRCYKCSQDTEIYTYIIFSDGTDEDVIYPWDKKRLLRNQDIFAHLSDPSIEYYGLKVIGGNARLDKLLMQKLPEEIKIRFSKTQNRSYPMNVCRHCGAKQGEYFIYRYVNEMITNMQPIDVFEKF